MAIINHNSISGVTTVSVGSSIVVGDTFVITSNGLENITQISATGVITATSFSGALTGNVTGSATALSGTPDVTVGTLNATDAIISGDLTVQGTTTTLDTVVTEVDKLEVDANNTNVAVAVTQSGTGDILRLYDGATQVVTVKDGGSVGIGTDTPNLQSTSANNLVIADFGGEGGITIKSNINSAGNIFFADTAATANGRIAYGHGTLDAGDYMRFYVANEEKLRINANGNIGIGTNNPTYRLQLEGLTNDAPFLINTGNVNGPHIRFAENGSVKHYIGCAPGLGGGGDSEDLAYRSADSHIFMAGATETFRITSGGAINQNGTAGISYFKGSTEYIFGSNTSSPLSGGVEALVQIHQSKTRNTLNVNGYQDNSGGPIIAMISSRSGTVGLLGTASTSGDTLGELRFAADNGTSTNAVYGSIIRSVSTANATSNGVAADLRFFTSPDNTGTGVQERLRITSDGDLLSHTGGSASYDDITGASNAGLVIGSSSYESSGIVVRTSGLGTCRLYFADNSGTSNGRRVGSIEYSHDNDKLAFTAGGSNTINMYAGNVRISGPGSTSGTSQSPLAVSSNLGTITAFFGTQSDVTGLTASQYSSAIRFNGAEVAWGDIAYFPNGDSDKGSFRFGRHGSTISSTPTATIGVSGVYFPGTSSSNPNTLDDYEEGTWTASAFNGANGATTTVNGSSRAANYVKIGKMVYISCYISLTKGTNTGNFEIHGLPFPVDGTNSAHYPLAVGFFSGFANNMSAVMATAQPGSSHVLGRFIPAGHDDKVSVLTGGNLGTGTVEFMFGGCYRTSA